jgi:sugar lactone lactonase YvrE
MTMVFRSLAAVLAILAWMEVATAEELFVSQRLTPPDDRYTSGIEGPAVDAANNLYVVNFIRSGTIGRVRAGQNRSEIFAVLPNGSIGNGIRFDRNGRMFVADFKKHNVFVFEPGQTTVRTYFHSDLFNQPNDLAISSDGTLYASDPDFRGRRGQIWRITPAPNGAGNGVVMQSARVMGVTNGLDLSPDGRTLYVAESNTRQIWAYRIDSDKLTEPRLVKTFDGAELDGLRTDVDGRILIARPASGKVTLLTPEGTIVREIQTLGQNPSNLTFGAADGRTVYVTQVDGRFVEVFRTDRRGRETCPSSAGAGC